MQNGRIDPKARRRRRADYRRWQRGRPMELWQMDVVGGIHLAEGAEVKCVTGIDDNSRFVVSAMLVARATARPVCDALLAALHRHGIPEQILTDNGKVFTGLFGPGGASSEPGQPVPPPPAQAPRPRHPRHSVCHPQRAGGRHVRRERAVYDTGLAH